MTGTQPDIAITLDRQIRQVLIELELLSHGTTTRFDKAGGVSSDQAGLPTGESSPPHIRWRKRFHDAYTDERRQRLLKDAQDELIEYRKGNRASDTRPRLSDQEILDDRVIREGSGWTPQEVARTFRCTIGHVRRTRTRNGRHPETGASLYDLSSTERQRLIADLAAAKLSQQQIADRMGIHQTTVSQLLRTVRPNPKGT